MLPKLNVIIGADTKELNAELEKSKVNLQKFAKTVAVAAGAAAVAMGGMVKAGLDNIDTQAKLAQSLNTTVKSIQVLERAGALAGVSMQGIEQATKDLTRRLSQAATGAGPAVDALERLGLTAKELGEVPLDKRIEMINNAIAEFVPLAEQAAVAGQLFGEEGSIAMSRIDSATIRQAADDLRLYGLAVSELDADNIEAANDAITRLGIIWGGLVTSLTVAATPAIILVADNLAKLSIILRALPADSTRAMNTLVSNINIIGDAIGGKIDWIKSKFNELMAFLGALPGRMMELGENIVQGLLDGITAKWGDLKAKVTELAEMLPEWVKDILDIRSPSRVFFGIGEDIMDGLTGGIVSKSSDVMANLQSIAGTMQSAMSSGFMSMIDGTKTVASAFKDMAKSIIAKLYEVLVVQQIVGGFNAATGAGTGLVGMAMKAFSSFEGGGFTGNGPRTGGLDGKGGQLAIVHPRETIIDHTKPGGQQMGGGGTVVVNQSINVTTGVQATVRSEIVSLMPQISESAKMAVLDARKRGGGFAGAF